MGPKKVTSNAGPVYELSIYISNESTEKKLIYALLDKKFLVWNSRQCQVLVRNTGCGVDEWFVACAPQFNSRPTPYPYPGGHKEMSSFWVKKTPSFLIYSSNHSFPIHINHHESTSIRTSCTCEHEHFSSFIHLLGILTIVSGRKSL